MPHQCVRCGTLYDDGDSAILKGCPKCGGKLFFYIRKETIKEAEKATENLTKDERKEIEKDVLNLVKYEEEKPVILDFESIRVLKPGKFEIDLVNLFKNEPLVYKLEDGKYVIDLPETFKTFRKK